MPQAAAKLEVLPLDQIIIPGKIKGVDLSEDQQLRVVAGEKVLVENMLSRTGSLFDGYIQINASDKKFDFNPHCS